MSTLKDVIKNVQLLEELKTRISDDKTDITEFSIRYTPYRNDDYTVTLGSSGSYSSTYGISTGSISAPQTPPQKPKSTMKFFSITIEGYIDE